MINVTLIAVGKLKEKYLRDAVAEYLKRLGAFCKINIIEIDEEKVGDNPSKAQIDNVLEKEGQRIIKKIPKSSRVITLCIEGKEYSSPDFSHLLDPERGGNLAGRMFHSASYGEGNLCGASG